MSPSGVLVVDKPCGPTSHDVVRWARKAFATRAVGHAGTLDPMASGVLVLAIGEGTKLVQWLTAEDKHYAAQLVLGVETDTLDAQGRETESLPVPELSLERVREIAQRFLGPQAQIPPMYSAIKLEGRPMHERARRGETIELAARDVTVHAVDIRKFEGNTLDFSLSASKGFYVRSLARDLARALGTCGHLGMLRRTASGAFLVEHAFDGERLRHASLGDAEALAGARAALSSLEAACVAMPRVVLDEQGEIDARHGRAIAAEHVLEGADLCDREPIALFTRAGLLIAIGSGLSGRLRVVRGIQSSAAGGDPGPSGSS